MSFDKVIFRELDLSPVTWRAVIFGAPETTPPPVNIWILADGTWNDGGVWIDTEQWNDSAP